MREALAQSRTLKDTSMAGLATVGVPGVEVAQEILAKAQSASLPLMPYLDTLRWVFIALARAGIRRRSLGARRRLDAGAALVLAAMLIAALALALVRPWARRAAALALAALAILLLLLNLRRAGRAPEQLETLARPNVLQRQMLDAATQGPRNRDDLLDCLRRGKF